MMRKCVAAVVLLSLLSGGLSAPLSSCDSLVKPITLSIEDMLGRWLYIGGSSDYPGGRSVGHLITNITATAQNNVLNIIQTQRIFDICVSLTYNLTFKNSTIMTEQPFYIKQVFLPTNCSDCLVVLEDVVSGSDTFTALMLFSRRKSILPAVVEAFRTQAECLRMPSPIMIDTDYELCPDDASLFDLLRIFDLLLDAMIDLQVTKLLDIVSEK